MRATFLRPRDFELDFVPVRDFEAELVADFAEDFFDDLAVVLEPDFFVLRVEWLNECFLPCDEAASAGDAARAAERISASPE